MQLIWAKARRGAWAALLVIGCSPDDAAHTYRANRRTTGNAEPVSGANAAPSAQTHAGAVATLSPAEWEDTRARVIARVDSIDGKLRRVRGLSRQEKTDLRRDVNAVQIERARQLGIKPGAPVEALAASGRLVKLADTTEHWIVRDLNYSLPYVTPSTRAMLAEIGRRFQAKLDTLGVPPYRLDITSVLRTPDKQAELRRRNSNASRIESSHEFGTTVDLAYRRFAAPPPEANGNGENGSSYDPLARQWSDSVMVEIAGKRSGELQAVLGRVLHEMQREGKVLVRMERRQTVYHITVGRSY